MSSSKVWGSLKQLLIEPTTNGDPRWRVSVSVESTESGPAQLTFETSSRLVLAVLETPFKDNSINLNSYPISVETNDSVRLFQARVLDERENMCTGSGGIEFPPPGTKFETTILSPTAMSYFDREYVWLFFTYFGKDKRCLQIKGRGLELYLVAEEIWKQNRRASVVLDEAGFVTHIEKA